MDSAPRKRLAPSPPVPVQQGAYQFRDKCPATYALTTAGITLSRYDLRMLPHCLRGV